MANPTLQLHAAPPLRAIYVVQRCNHQASARLLGVLCLVLPTLATGLCTWLIDIQ
jgi:hypothetical protein